MSKLKVVFHLDFDDTPTFELSLANITNFLNDVGAETVDIALLANGFAVKLFVKASAMKFREKLEELHKQGVKFYVCNNALNVHNISKEDIFELCEVVPAGITKLVELQREGYAYIKP
ncbi:DsrE family protein [Archaeoglobus sulfaticallidus]|nr:DsrE family protein [Archaeoglobus sulfaticallidus]